MNISPQKKVASNLNGYPNTLQNITVNTTAVSVTWFQKFFPAIFLWGNTAVENTHGRFSRPKLSGGFPVF